LEEMQSHADDASATAVRQIAEILTQLITLSSGSIVVLVGFASGSDPQGPKWAVVTAMFGLAICILSGLYAKMVLYLWHVRDIRGKATDRVRQVADVTGGIAAFAFVVALIALAVYGSHVLA
jgi:hypothetical protein